MMAEKIPVETGGGNVFADLGLPEAETLLTKAELAARIGEAIGTRRLTQAAAADLLGVDQPKISRLLRGQIAGLSTERLLQFLALLGRDVDILVKPAPRSRRRGRVRVIAAA